MEWSKVQKVFLLFAIGLHGALFAIPCFFGIAVAYNGFALRKKFFVAAHQCAKHAKTTEKGWEQ